MGASLLERSRLVPDVIDVCMRNTSEVPFEVRNVVVSGQTQTSLPVLDRPPFRHEALWMRSKEG